MDALFNVFGFGMQKPDEKYRFFENQRDRNIEEEKRRRGIFWKDKTNTGIDFTSMGGTGPLDQKGRQILPSDKNYPGTNINQIQNQNRYQDPIQTGGVGQSANNEDMGFMSKLANMAGVDIKEATANWKDKGGFEGLMSNPGFTLGLALMQSSAQGKRIDEGILDNFVKAAGISAQFKDRMDARAGGVIEATEGQMDDIKGILSTMGISGPGWRKILPGNQSESYEQAVEDITIKVQEKVNKMKKDAKASGKDIVVGSRLKKKIIQDMIDSGEISKKRKFIDKTIEAKPMARGGPVTKGKPYVVGEQGPEYFLPKESGKIVSNDDSRIFAMLLAANPQLQQVSKTRAEKIIRSRFPEYFD